MKSRMDKYYDTVDTKARTSKNQQLYHTIYDEVEYSNVEGISIIEKNEKIDIDMIRELINKNQNPIKEKKEPIRSVSYNDEILEDEKNYDIRDILNKAKDNRVVDNKRVADTQYNILKEENKNRNVYNDYNNTEDDLKGMIDAISANSKGYTVNLLDDLRSIYDPKLKNQIEETMESSEAKEVKETKKEDEIDRSFYTNTMGFKEEDFEDLKEIKDDVKQNSIITNILISVLTIIIVVGLLFLGYHFLK